MHPSDTPLTRTNNQEGQMTASVQPSEHHAVLNRFMAMQAVREIETRYHAGVHAYAEGIEGFNAEIEKIKLRIQREEESKASQEQRLSEIEAEITYQERLLQKLNENFAQEISSVEELQEAYKEMLEASDYKRTLQRKKREIAKVSDEIHECEIILLKEEMERLNLLEKLEPKRESLMELKAILKELELQKRHFESTKLHQIPQLGSQESLKPLAQTVETEVIQEHPQT